MAKFDHVVNHNGIYYKAGEEVPIMEEAMPTPVVEETKEIKQVEEEVESPRKRRRSRKE